MSGRMRTRGEYTVVGCRECDWLWIIEDLGGQQTVECPRCQTSYPEHQVKGLNAFADGEKAAAWRSARLTQRSDYDGDEYMLLSYEQQQERAEGGVIDPETAHPDADLWAAKINEWEPRQHHPDADLWETLCEDWQPRQHHPDADLWDTLATELLTQTGGEVEDNRGRPGIEPLRPPEQGAVNCLTEVGGMPPQSSDWVPDLLDALVEPAAQAFEQRMNDADDASPLADLYPAGDPETWTAEQQAGAEWLATLQLYVERRRMDGTDDRCTELRERLTHLAMGDGLYNEGIGALYYGPVAALRSVTNNAGIRCRFDAQAWADLDDRGTGKRSLVALSILGAALRVEVVLSSPDLEHELRRRYPEWTASNLELTESWDTTQEESSQPDDLTAAAWDALVEYKDGHRRLLANLLDDSRQQRALSDDPEVDLAESSVSRYVGDLTADGLVSVDASGEYNEVALTGVGVAAVSMIDSEDYSLQPPSQTTLDAYFTPTPHRNASAVYSAQGTREGGEAVQSAEAWLAETGDPTTADEDYVQWLDGPTETLDAWLMHQRMTGPVRGQGVTLVEDRIKTFNDSRVGYASCFEDELLAVVQYGKPLRTMGRIAGILLSERVLSKVLAPSVVGDDLDGFYDEAREEFEAELRDVLKWGNQIDARWFSEEEVDDYDDFREAVRDVRQVCLSRLGELAGSDRYEERGRLMEDLWGLITSATHLHYAAGNDVVINVRVPNSRDWGEIDREDFLDFVANLAEKQTVYDYHSGHRMVIEDRKEKLKRRLPYSEDLDGGDRAMDTTADVLLTGPAMLEFFDDVRAAVQSTEHRLRESVANGEEDAAHMEIPVHNGSSYQAVRELVEEIGGRKGYQTPTEDQIDRMQSPAHQESVDGLARLLLRSFNSSDRPHRCSPHDVVESLYRMAGSSRSVDWLTMADVEAGLCRMAPSRLLPDLPPTMTQLIQCVVASDEPMRRSEIIEQTGISGSSYGRHIREASALDIVERVEDDGRAAYSGHLTPWWGPESERTSPYDREQKYEGGEIGSGLGAPLRWQDLYTELYFSVDAAREGVDPQVLSSPVDTALHKRSPTFRRWRGFIWPLFASREELAAGPGGGPPDTDVAIVQIGPVPASEQPEQMALDDALSRVVTVGVAVPDGGRESKDGIGEWSR